jgi:hypothetical protein
VREYTGAMVVAILRMEKVMHGTYHKIQSVYKRDPDTNHKTFLEGDWSLPEFGYLANNQWDFTEKVDGTNIRISRSGDKAMFGGKTDNANLPSPLVAKLIERFPDAYQLNVVFGDQVDFTLYGEGFGAGIQKGGNYSKTQDFVLFDVRVGDWWLRREDVVDIARKLDLPVVPIIGSGTLFDAIEMTKAGFTSVWGNFIAEGIVARPAVELYTRSGDRVITKIKYRDFVR